MWSNFHLLVDTTVMLSEQEETQKKQSSSSVTMMKRRYGVSTSSSSLLDLNKIPQNPNPKEDSSSLFPSNPQQRFDPFNVASTSSLSIMKLKDPPNPKEESSSLFPSSLWKKVYTKRSNPQQHFDPFNVASTSSLSIMKLNPPNPKEKSSSLSSCLIEKTSRKRLAKKQRKSNCGFKRPKIDRLRFLERKVPDWVFNVMRNINSEVENPRLIFETNLSASDVNPNQSRLLIPFNMLIINDFLTPAEVRAMNKQEYNQEDENVGVGTIVVNQRSEMLGLRFKIWSMEKKNSGKGTLNYALNWGWNDVVEDNNLKANDKIILWTFRCRDVLCFALDLSERV